MIGIALVLPVVMAADATLQGEVRLTRAVGEPLVSIAADTGTVSLDGDLTQEIGRLQGGKVEIGGVLDPDGKRFHVRLYRILEVGGVRPLVGMLVEIADGLALKDGEGAPIPLSLSPRVHEKLTGQIGAKLWVAGKKLLSGQLKVQRYGVLRDPPRIAPSGAAPP